MVTPFFVFRGLGKRFNPLALEARDSRFESGVPDQFFDNLRQLRAGVVYRLCPGPPTRRRDFEYLRPLQVCLRGCGSLVERRIASPANGVRFSALAPAVVVQWEERGARIAQTAVRTRAPAPASVAQWQSSRTVGGRFRVRFPALAPSVPGKHKWRCAGFVNRISQFDSDTRLHSGKALRASNRLITDREMVRFHLPEPGFSKLHCGVDWRWFQLGLISQRRAFESRLRNHFIRWASRSTGGLLACTQ